MDPRFAGDRTIGSRSQRWTGNATKSKAIAITMMVLAVTLSIIFAITSTLIQILVGGVGIIGVWYVGVRVPKEKVLAVAILNRITNYAGIDKANPTIPEYVSKNPNRIHSLQLFSV